MRVVHGLIPALVTLAHQTTGTDRVCVERTIELLQARHPTQDGVIWELTRVGHGVVRVTTIVDTLYAMGLSRQARVALHSHLHHRLADLGYERIAPGTFRQPDAP